MNSIDAQLNFSYLGLFASILSAVAAVMAVRVIKTYSEMEQLLSSAVETGSVGLNMDSDDLLDA